jgi:hypothetical protein
LPFTQAANSVFAETRLASVLACLGLPFRPLCRYLSASMSCVVACQPLSSLPKLLPIRSVRHNYTVLEECMPNRTAVLAFVLAFGFPQQSGTTPAPASQAPEKQTAVAAATPASSSSAAAVTVPVATPAHTAATDGLSTLYFYRPRLYRGSAVRIGFFVDGTMVVNLVNGRWGRSRFLQGTMSSNRKTIRAASRLMRNLDKATTFAAAGAKRECSTALIKTS